MQNPKNVGNVTNRLINSLYNVACKIVIQYPDDPHECIYSIKNKKLSKDRMVVIKLIMGGVELVIFNSHIRLWLGFD